MTAAPMAVTLDATLSGSTSNSYLTLVTAEQIAANMPGGPDWIAATQDEKNLSLIQATRWLETLNYKGDRCKASQRLKWPRSGAVCDGVTSDCSAFLTECKKQKLLLPFSTRTNPICFLATAAAEPLPLERM